VYQVGIAYYEIMNQRIAAYLGTMFLAQGSNNHPFDVRICLAFAILCVTNQTQSLSCRISSWLLDP
jgi:hypothetical protein